VLGDFNDASVEHFGVRSRFFRQDGRFFVETDGPDGNLGTFQIKYTFGIDPLQQYLVEFSDGRLQALSLAWDSRPKQNGGQHWFHLYPNEQVGHDDALHWTKLNQNWNFMCAECHSTGVHKNYDASANRFATSWAEISVGCEACHGQGSAHVAWANEERSWRPFGRKDDPSKGLLARFDERHEVSWRPDPRTGNPLRNYPPATLRKEVETCGRCHARRGALSEDWVPGRWLSDTHVVSPLASGLYHADGQMRDEVYNYGSLKQSKMFAAGVTCSDCHEPHGAKLRASGNDVCLQCHSPAKYATQTHHHHDGVDPPLACASCHMPTRTYMVIDSRHDHSFRVPRPDVSAKLGIPNACNGCHSEKSAEWAAAAVENWHGPNRTGSKSYAEAFHAAWEDHADAATLLSSVAMDRNYPSFVRASALTELASHTASPNVDLAQTGLADPDPMVRIAALDLLERVPATRLWPLASPLLSDSVRGVRIRAASLLASVPSMDQAPVDRDRFERAANEFIAAQRLNADRPEAHSALGNFYAQRGRVTEAEAEFKFGLRLSPQFTPAAINLADLHRQLGQNGEAIETLRAALRASPRDAALHHALGLALVREKQQDGAIEELRSASELGPAQARYSYVYAVALNSVGRAQDAMNVLLANLARHPGDRDTLMALVGLSRDNGNVSQAIEYAERLALLTPSDRALAGLIDALRQQADPAKR